MAGKGGARPGAGRKPKAQRYQSQIRKAEKRVADRLPDLVDCMFDLATGVQVEETGDDGEPRVYARPPDRKAIEYLWNRIAGIPTARIEVENSGAVGVTFSADELAQAKAEAARFEHETFGDLDASPDQTGMAEV